MYNKIFAKDYDALIEMLNDRAEDHTFYSWFHDEEEGRIKLIEHYAGEGSQVLVSVEIGRSFMAEVLEIFEL